MSKLTIELCPETGICTIIKEDAGKFDLLPDEVARIREASGDTQKVRATLAEANESLAGKLEAAELEEVAAKLR